MIAALLVVALQQPTAPPPPPKPTMQSPIAKAVVQPAEAAVTVGDTLRLSVSAFDSAGRPYTDYSSNWFTSGGFFEGGVDSTGLVTGGSTWNPQCHGPGPSEERGQAGHRDSANHDPASSGRSRRSRSVPTKLYVGQSMLITATPFAANDDRRYDQVAWTSDRAGVVTVSPEGRLMAKAAGKANITATAGTRDQNDPHHGRGESRHQHQSRPGQDQRPRRRRRPDQVLRQGGKSCRDRRGAGMVAQPGHRAGRKRR
jgi:hypothetical protein